MAASDRVSDAAISLLRLGSRPAAMIERENDLAPLPQALVSLGLLKRTSSLIRINDFRRASGKIDTISR
jgi:hypothetical protein